MTLFPHFPVHALVTKSYPLSSLSSSRGELFPPGGLGVAPFLYSPGLAFLKFNKQTFGCLVPSRLYADSLGRAGSLGWFDLPLCGKSCE